MIEAGQIGRATDFSGLVVIWAGASIPAGWLECDGSAVSRTTYAFLFGLIGTGYGAGDGSTTFNVPDLRGSVPVGAGQKNIILASTVAYTGINTTLETMTFATAHGLYTTDEVAVTSSGTKPSFWMQDSNYYYTGGVSYTSQSVDGSGNIGIQNFIPADLAVNTKIRVFNQSSTNFVNNTEYFIISNSGSSIQVSATQGGSVFGAGNAGSLNFEVRVPLRKILPYLQSNSSTDGSGNYSMASDYVNEPYKVNDVLMTMNASGGGGNVSIGAVYYVVSVNLTNMTYQLSATLGGSPITAAAAGQWGIFIAYRPDVINVIKVSETAVKFALNRANAFTTTVVDIADAGSGNHTLTKTLSLATRALAETGGEESHVLSNDEIPPHVHQPLVAGKSYNMKTGGGSGGGSSSDSSAATTGYNTTKAESHNNMQPFVVVKFIIKT